MEPTPPCSNWDGYVAPLAPKDTLRHEKEKRAELLRIGPLLGGI